MSMEILKPVPGLEHIEINPDGTVIKVNGELKYIRYTKNTYTQKKYRIIYLGNEKYRVHHLVYRTYIGPIERKITFKDGNTLNCFYKNLLPQIPWLPENIKLFKVPNWPDVKINNDGSIITQFGYEVPIGVIKNKNKDYYRVCLRNYENKAVDTYVHLLVANTFLRIKERSEVVFHIDGNTKNNHYQNLKILNKSQLQLSLNRCEEYKKNKLKNSRNKSKIKEADIPYILTELKKGTKFKKLADQFNTSEMSIHRVKKRYLSDQEIEEINKLKNKHATNRIDPKTKQFIARLVRSKKHSISLIAEMCCVSIDTVYKIKRLSENHSYVF